MSGPKEAHRQTARGPPAACLLKATPSKERTPPPQATERGRIPPPFLGATKSRARKYRQGSTHIVAISWPIAASYATRWLDGVALRPVLGCPTPHGDGPSSASIAAPSLFLAFRNSRAASATTSCSATHCLFGLLPAPLWQLFGKSPGSSFRPHRVGLPLAALLVCVLAVSLPGGLGLPLPFALPLPVARLDRLTGGWTD